MLKATYSEEDKCWYLNGVKRFITDGTTHLRVRWKGKNPASKEVVVWIGEQQKAIQGRQGTIFATDLSELGVISPP